MNDKVEICREITEVLLQLGEYGRELKVSFDDRLQVWKVSYDQGGRHAMIFLEEEEVELCLSGKECLTRGVMAQKPGQGAGAFR